MRCRFTIVDGVATCRNCGQQVKTKQTNPKKVRAECIRPNPEDPPFEQEGETEKEKKKRLKHRPPTFLQKLKNFTVAAISHVIKGMPTCSQEEIDKRLQICKACPLNYFEVSPDNPDVGVCNHRKCGCNINKEDKFLNKLGHKNQSCPEGFWGPID